MLVGNFPKGRKYVSLFPVGGADAYTLRMQTEIRAEILAGTYNEAAHQSALPRCTMLQLRHQVPVDLLVGERYNRTPNARRASSECFDCDEKLCYSKPSESDER